MSRSVLTRDTAREAEQVQVRIWRSMSPLEKAQLTSAVTRGANELALAGIRSRYPDATSRELKIRMARLTLGAEWTRRIYPNALELLEC